MNWKNALVCITGALLLAGCRPTETSQEVYKIHRFENNPYLAEVWWGEDYDPEQAIEVLKNNPLQQAGGCSSWHKGSFHGRNIDWMMRDYATMIVHLPKSDKVKYASVGLIAGNSAVTRDFISNNECIPESMRAFLPATIVDGINECGVAINHNIVPYDGQPYCSEGDLSTMMVCRYVLDNCATAQEAVDLLCTKKVAQTVVKIAHDYSHFLVSDPTCSYVLEWDNNTFVATEFKADGEGNFLSANNYPAIMTNYFVSRAEKYGFKTREFFLQHPEGAGVERADIITSMLPQANTVEDHLNICKAVWYRKFCLGQAPWPTENAGFYGYSAEKGQSYWVEPGTDSIHWMDSDDVYAAAQALLQSEATASYCEDFRQNGDTLVPNNNYWYTQHSVVYDLDNRKGYVIVQEGRFSDEVIEICLK